MDWDKITPDLERKLDPAHVKPPKQYGPKGDYLEGWFVIQEANRIFGFGGWSYRIKGLTKDACEKVTKADGKEQWQAAYTCIVEFHVGEVVREDVGFGSGFATQIGDAIEGATKEAVTDGLKRCLRTFGNPFGLALYDKSRANVGVDLPPFNEDAAYNRILTTLDAAASLDELQHAWKLAQDDLKRMNAEHFAKLEAAKDEAKARLTANDPPF